MYVSMKPKGETGKVIHISQNDTNREVEFIPFDQKGLTPLTDGQLMARINSIKGNTVSFNQLLNALPTQTINGITLTNNGDGTITLNGTATANADFTYYEDSTGRGFKGTLNHKYYVKYGTIGSITTYSQRIISNGGLSESSQSYNDANGKILTCVDSTKGTGILIRVVSGQTVTNLKMTQMMLFDLTLMGIDNLTTVTEVENWLSTHIGNLPYFNFGYRLISFNGTGLKTVGFNIFNKDAIWTSAGNYIINDNGVQVSDGTSSYYLEYINVCPNLTYYSKTGTNDSGLQRIYFYDNSNNFISRTGAISTGDEFTTPSNCYKIRIQYRRAELKTSLWCINISSSENGQYKAYTSNTLSLPTQTYFPFGEDGINNVRDELIPDSDVYKKMGIVNLGNLVWGYGGNGKFYASLNAKTVATNVKGNILCAKYITDTYGNVYDSTTDKTIAVHNTRNEIYVYDSSYSGATAFKESLANTYLVYELATPLHNYGVVNLGELEWTLSLNSNYFYAILPNNSVANTLSAVCPKYRISNDGTSIYNGAIDKVLGVALPYISGNTNRVFIRDTDYNDATALKNSLANTYLLYELETPVAPSSMEDTYPVWKDGTEQILPVNTSSPTTAPIKANITYPDRTEDTEFLYKQTSFEWINKSWAFVCKNITQALSVVGNALKGTIPSGMTSVSGKFPLKLKMTDNDGVCFSEKIDLFVERKP